MGSRCSLEGSSIYLLVTTNGMVKNWIKVTLKLYQLRVPLEKSFVARTHTLEHRTLL